MPRLWFRDWQNALLAGVVLAALGAALGLTVWSTSGSSVAAPAAGPGLDEIPIDGRRAFGYLEEVCRLGPRPSGSPGMTAQQRLVVGHWEKCGGRVQQQRFRIRHPVDGSPVEMANLWGQWHLARRDRVLLAAHYDTRPFPDRDPVDPRGTFVGANDGASGVALLMELAHWLSDLEAPVGVDLVLFDGEEFVFGPNDQYFYGSEYFARMLVADQPRFRYRAAVVLDMVGDRNLQIFREQHSVRWPESRPVVESLWKTAKRLGVKEFYHRTGYEVRDDHLALYQIAGIPACDVIDFDYPAWHTRGDLPEECSPLSLAKVGWVVWEWLRNQPPAR